MEQAIQTEQASRLTNTERLMLALPVAASAFVGLFQLLLPGLLAKLTGYSGHDLYIYELSGTATFGYAVALGLGLLRDSWASVRLVVIAFFTFGLASLYACVADIVSGTAKPVVYVVLALTIVFLAITGTRLYVHRGEAKRTPDTAKWIKWFVVIATVLAATFGLLPLLFPTLSAPFFHLQGTDVFIFRQSGAAALGYAVMGVYELRSLNWQEMRLPFVMGGVFNGLAFIVSVLVIILGTTTWLPYLVGPAALGVTLAIIVALRRHGA